MSMLEFGSAPDEKFPAVQITTGETPARSRMTIQLRTKVLLVDDNTDSRAVLRSLLEKEPDMELIGEADGAASVRLAGVLKPDVVAMALGTFDREGMEMTRQIIAASPDVKVLAISPYFDSRFVVKTMLQCGYMLTDCAFEELGRAVRAVASGHT